MIDRRNATVPSLSQLAGRMILSVFVIFGVCLCLMTSGCKPVTVRQPSSATAPTDPYATALSGANIFSQALLDAKTSVVALHTTQIAWADGSVSTVLDDEAYGKVNAALGSLAVEGTKLSNLLAARATPAQITLQMSALTAVLASQLSPTTVGIKNPSAQQKYIVVTSLLGFALNTLANYVALIPAPQEASYELRRSRRADPALERSRSDDPYRDRADPEGSASVATSRPLGAPRPGQREFRQGTRLLADALA